MSKTYVIDTNILVHDAEAVFKFADNHLIIPLCVVEELDGLKKDQREVGRNARHALRIIDKLVEDGAISDSKPINPLGGTVAIALSEEQFKPNLPTDLDWKITDNRILAVALAYGAILVSKDTNLRIKAHSIGVKAENYTNDKVDVEGLYTGHRTGYVSEEDLNILYAEGVLPRAREVFVGEPKELFPNQCVTLYNLSNPKQSAIVRFDAALGFFALISGNTLKPAGLQARNQEQLAAIDLMMNPDIKLVTVIGKAGCGKTLCALASAMHSVLDLQEYEKILVARPIVPMGNDIGYLPGSMEEKLGPWMAPIKDNIEFLMNLSVHKEMKRIDKVADKATKAKTSKAPGKSSVTRELHEESYAKDFAKIPGMDELVAHGKLEIAPLTYIRGRSLPKQIMIIDEAQQLTPHEIKTIITRIGEGSKIILTGDIEQIDAPYLDASSNGLSFVVEKFKDQKIAAHITLTRSERSELADIASRIL